MAFASRLLAAVVLCAAFALAAPAEIVQVSGTGAPGVSLTHQSAGGVELHFGIDTFGLEPVAVGDQILQRVSLPGVILPNDAGAPDLPGIGRNVAMPRGATARLEIVSSRMEVRHGVEIAPAPVIPKETEDGPLVVEANPDIYGRNAFYPENPVILSDPAKIRGVDMVTVGITPFQYNPVTRELRIWTDLDIRVVFEGGTGSFGEDRLRSRWWEPILEQNLVNYETLPRVDFDRPRDGRDGFDYVILVPDHPDFLAWADTLKAWRQLEGISTGIFTVEEIGGTTPAGLEAWINNAYATWDPAPSAFLLLGDYPQSPYPGITSPIYNSYCVSDNILADYNADHLPDMVHARITARNAAELEEMIGKMLDYERRPPTDVGFYDHPIIAGGWQTERWFILCNEVVYGHQANVLGKNPVREYAIYSGTPGSVWSTATNTSTVVNYFGPSGLGYIPATPQHLTDWGSNATRINNDINTGAYILMHRDHGGETGWGEPDYGNGDLGGLHNEMLPFVFSMNCLTGKYNYSGESFTERFHRMAHGALGLTAASEVSYSFVNDCLVWGSFDAMWPGFMPDYGPYPPTNDFVADLRPAFGMCSGKHFLRASNWPYNTGDKTVTYHLFHHHGDAFLRLYSEVPRALTVTHDEVCLIGVSSFAIQAEEGALIGLTIDGQIVGVADATGLPQEIGITPPTQPGDLRVTVTKPNCYRYDVRVPIIPPEGPYLVYETCTVDDASGDGDGILDAAETANLHVLLENVGVEGTSGVTATLMSGDPLVEILVGEVTFPDIPAGGTGGCIEPFVVQASGAVPDGHAIVFTVHAVSNEGSWDGGFSLPAQAPVLMAENLACNDGPSGDGVADPGETVTLVFRAGNAGHSDCGPLTGTLTAGHPSLIVVDGSGDCGGIEIGGVGEIGPFTVEVGSLCPDPSAIPLHLELSGEAGFVASLDFILDIGAWFDDVESARGWTLGATGDNATSGRWERVDPIGTTQSGQPVQPEDDHTPGLAVMCFVTGNGSPGGAVGEADVDGGKTTLLSPVFDLEGATAATVSYWRWYTNDLGNNPSSDYWDVEVTANGTDWISLEHTSESANTWTQMSFDLTEFISLTGTVQLRFVAADEGSGSLVEAAVDDFILDASYQSPSSAGDLVVIREDGLVGIRPNPFNPHTTILFRTTEKGTAALTVFDVAGRRVRSLLDGTIPAGEHAVTFDGRDGTGHPLASGIYFLRLETPKVLQVRQMTLLK